jgi:trk system potassium uptake protein TrkH
VKLARVLLLVRQSARELERLSHPHGVMLIKIGKTSVSDAAMQGVWTFFVMFVFSLILLAVALSTMGLEFDHALVLAVSALTNCGPVLLDAGGFPTDMSALGSTAHGALAIGMLVGRLEVFTVLVLVTPMFWER